jgi:hypothetical protein
MRTGARDLGMISRNFRYFAIGSGEGGDAMTKQETWRGEVRQGGMWAVRNLYNLEL